MLLFTACDFLFGDTGVKPGDPYDVNCNLKDDYQENWYKYSDFDERIPLESRSYEAQQVYGQIDQITEISEQMYNLEVETEVENLMKQELINYKTALANGHKKNLIKSFLRLSLYTADITWQHAIAGKEYGDLLMDSSKTGIQLVGEGIKLINSYAPSDSVIAIDASTKEGQVKDVKRSAWMETIAIYGTEDYYKVPLEMAKKATRYVMETPDPKLSDADIKILQNEHLKLKEIDNLIQDANKRNFERMWKIRELKQEQTNLENSLIDLEYKEKERVDEMLIAECKQKTEGKDKGILGFLGDLE